MPNHCNTIQYHVTPFDIQSTAERSRPFVCSNTKFTTVLKHNIGLSDSSISNEGEFYISTFLRFVLQAYFYCLWGEIFFCGGNNRGGGTLWTISPPDRVSAAKPICHLQPIWQQEENPKIQKEIQVVCQQLPNLYLTSNQYGKRGRMNKDM